MTYDLETFGLSQMIESSRAIRLLGATSSTMEDAAREVVDFLYNSFLTSTGEPACALVRCFKTNPYDTLPEPLQAIAGPGIEPGTQCLSLLATRGKRTEWNSRQASAGHQAIPLTSPAMVAQAPMIARLMHDMGIQAKDVLEAATLSPGELDRRALDVFYVSDASGSPHIPAQADFVQPNGVRSVLGFGGILPTGSFFFILMFTVVPIPPSVADMFRTFALGFKLVMLAQINKPTFSN